MDRLKSIIDKLKSKVYKLKLKWRIFGFLLGFCALLLVILWLFQMVFLNDMYKFIRKYEINKAISLVEKNINSSDLQSIFDKLSEENEIFVMPTNGFAPPKNIKQGNRGHSRMEAITQTKKFTLRNGETVSLTFYALITPVNATIETLKYQLYFITGFMVILSVLIAVIIAKRISKPIEDINSSAKALAGGDYDTKFSGCGFLEIKELSDTLNIASKELSTVEGLRRELMANISHDLRTPLSLIYSYAEIMHDFPDEITAEQTQIIMDEAKRLTSLVNDVFDISKLESGVMQLNLSSYNLTESIRRTTDRIAELVKKDGYLLHFDYDKMIFVRADEVKITQVFYNLLINAINYSGDNKCIAIRQSIENGFVKIEVCDHGKGIESENLPYIWERYYKVDKTHKRAITGTGLGLSIVKKVIDLHGGKYGVFSKIGKGSTFWFSLKID